MLQDQLNQRFRDNQEMDEQIKEISRPQQEHLMQRAGVDSLENCQGSCGTELTELEEAEPPFTSHSKRDNVMRSGFVRKSRRSVVSVSKSKSGLVRMTSSRISIAQRKHWHVPRTRQKVRGNAFGNHRHGKGQLLEASNVAYKAVQERKPCSDFEGEQQLLDQERRELALKKEKLEKLRVIGPDLHSSIFH
jgi:hypothetical protein